MTRSACAVVIGLGLLSLGSAGEVEVWHVDLERTIASSEAGRAARRRVASLERRLQSEADAREARIGSLRAEAEASRSVEGGERLRQAVEDHARRMEAATSELERAITAELEPLVKKLRQHVRRWESSRRRVLVLEDHPLLSPPARCDLSNALRAALDGRASGSVPAAPDCEARWVFLLGFDEAVRASRAGAEAASRIEALRRELQDTLDRHTQALGPRREAGDPSAELELAERFARNQAKLREAEEAEEARLYAKLEGAVAAAAAALPRSRFVDAASLELPGAVACDARAWTREVLDEGADVGRLLERCGLKPPR